MSKFISKDGAVEISIRQRGNHRNAWALFINGQYKGSKVLPANNTAIVQNFGFPAEDFDAA